MPKPVTAPPPCAHEYQWSKPPARIEDVPGYSHPAHSDKVLQLDDEDITHFVKCGSIDVNAISDQLDVLMSGTTSWKTIYHTITDLFQFDSIVGSKEDFICLLIGIARSWDADAECAPAEVLKSLINNASSLVKVEEDLHQAQTSLSRIRNERNQAMTDVRKLVDTSNRLRKERNHLKTSLEDIAATGSAPTSIQYEALREEVAHLKDERDRLTKVIEHDKEALRNAEEENTAMTLQISLMNEDFDDKNAVIEALESASVEMMKEHANLELLHLSAKAELEASKSVIKTMKVQQDAEQKVYKSRIQRLKSRASMDGADINSSISRELAFFFFFFF